MNNVFSVFLGLFCLIVSDHFEHFPQKVYHLFYRCEVPWYISGTNLPEYSPFQSAWHFSEGCRAYFLSKFCFSKMSWSFHWFHLGQYRDFWNIVNFNSDKLSTLSDIDYFQHNVTKQWSLFSRQENAQIWYWLAGQTEQNYWGPVRSSEVWTAWLGQAVVGGGGGGWGRAGTASVVTVGGGHHSPYQPPPNTPHSSLSTSHLTPELNSGGEHYLMQKIKISARINSVTFS